MQSSEYVTIETGHKRFESRCVAEKPQNKFHLSPVLKKLIGSSKNFISQVQKLPLVAGYDSTVLLTGETGTGKELFAKALHELSPRSVENFVPVNCGAIPGDLVENELFGHKKEAFTGANSDRTGLVQEAHNGTLFLDEIDSLPVQAQVKLLRFLQEREFRSLGSNQIRKANVRLVAASNKNLSDSVTEGKLRQDLYYRLNVITIRLPALRERKQDIPELVQFFLNKHRVSMERPEMDFTPEALNELLSHDWPGNVRELQHTVERTAVLCQDPVIRAADIDFGEEKKESLLAGSFQEAKAKMIERFEKDYLQKILSRTGGNISEAARQAKKNRRAFWELLRKYDMVS